MRRGSDIGYFRSSPPEVFCKKKFLEILQNSQENTCVGKYQALGLQLC